MKHFGKLLLAVAMLAFCQQMRAQYTEQDIYIYIDTYKELAINKMYEYKIPASITIAQGIFESGCGKSHLAKDGNNHFGIKCHKDWTGDTILIDDDELQECFRKYEKVEDSYTDHSEFLKNRQRYASLFTLNVMDYPGWARGLKAAGYATNPQYADRLISIIERYHISYLDTIYQQRLQNGYFKNYPDVHPELLAEYSFAENHGKPVTPTAKPEQANEKPVTPQPTVAPQPTTEKPQPVKPARHGKVKNNQKANPQKNDSGHNSGSMSGTDKPANSSNSAKPAKSAPAPASASKADNNKPAIASQPSAQTAKLTPSAETDVVEELPTPLTVFSARDGQYPAVTDYPFTERAVYQNNKVIFVIAQKGDTYAKIAHDTQSKEKKLKKFNDATGTGKLQIGQVVYLEKKRNVGENQTYTVKNTESLLYISQKTGIKLKKLCALNGLSERAELKKGRILKLK